MRSHHFLLTTFLVFSLCLFPILAAAATPHIYDVPHVGPPGSQTSLVGNGFDPNATLDIYLDSTNVGLVDTDKDGSFGMALRAPTIRQNGLTVQIPKDAVPGQHWITAVERITQLQAQVQFVVSTDWPQFHFDAQHTGFNPYENVLSPETVGNLTTRWTFKEYVGGAVVANSAVYVNSQYYLYALDAGTGAVLWNYSVGNVGISPGAVVNGVVYASAGGDGVYALNAASGVLLWKAAGLAYGTLPAVANGVVYVATYLEGYLYALNAATGAILWKYDIGGSPQSSPTVADGVVYVAAGDVYALSADTGAVLWKFTNGFAYESPAVANGVVYVGSNDHNLYALEASAGTLIWKYAANSWIASCPAVANGVVYVGSGDNNIYALNAATGVLLWKYAAGDWVSSSPAVANGVLYVGSDDGNLYALDASTGALLWKYTTRNVVQDSPAVVNGMIYTSSQDGNFYAFGLPNQQMSEKFSPPQRPDPARLTPNWSPTLKK